MKKRILALFLIGLMTLSACTVSVKNPDNAPSGGTSDSQGGSTKPGAGGLKPSAGGLAEGSDKPGDIGDMNLPGNVAGGWSSDRFGDLPEPKNAQFSTANINNDQSGEFIGFSITAGDFEQYLKDLEAAGYTVRDETDGDQRDVSAFKDGNEVYILYKPGTGRGTLEYYPVTINADELWPKDYMPDVPVPHAELYSVDDYGESGINIGADFLNLDNFKSYIKQCEDAGFTLDPDCSEPDFSAYEIWWIGIDAQGGTITIQGMNEAGQVTANISLLAGTE